MVTTSSIVGIGLVALGLVLTPGPNMVYLVSRTMSHGRRAGFVSLLGIAVGFLCYLVAAVLGVASLFTLVPDLYVAVKLAGAAYLVYLAWRIARPSSDGVMWEGSPGPAASDRQLFLMGLVTNLLNPKIAILYLSLLPQFVDPALGSVGRQSLLLGVVQIVVALTVNGLIVLSAGSLAALFARYPRAQRVQRVTSGTLLASVAVRVALDRSRAVVLA